MGCIGEEGGKIYSGDLMTITLTTEISAGRELDALIAEKVMGWVKTLRLPNAHDTWDDPAGLCKSWVEMFTPSTDISAAWQVVEKLRLSQFDVHLCTATVFGDWKCGFWKGSAGTVSASTAPLAICLASLRAVENVKP